MALNTGVERPGVELFATGVGGFGGDKNADGGCWGLGGVSPPGGGGGVGFIASLYRTVVLVSTRFHVF